MKKLWRKVIPKRVEVQGTADTRASAILITSSPTATSIASPRQQNALPQSEPTLPSSHRPSLNEEDPAPFGFKSLYEPSSSDTITVDIIAIHGLNGHRETTWTQVLNGGRETIWLRDLVPKSIPSARIVSYGYDAKIDGPSHQTLAGHAQDFVVRLMQFRTEGREVQRPIVFLVHGTGGIVLQLALLEAFRANEMHLADREAIKFSTYGIIFLGTPHQGLLSTSLSQAETDTAHALNVHLKPNSEYLQDLVTMFTPIRGYFDIKFIYETRPKAGETHLTVFKASAVLPGAANIETLGLNRDHAALARFTSPDDGDYLALVSMMANMVKKAPEAVESHWRTRTLGAEVNLKTIVLRMDEILNQLSQVTTSSAQPEENRLFQDGQPPVPPLFLGRETELGEMRDILLKNSCPRLVILGSGGMGKTTVAQQLMNDEEVLKTFPTPLFVSCENATSTTAILNAVADVLHIPADQRGQTLKTNVSKHLRSRPGYLLCLDNFEDAWDPPSTRRTIEDLLTVFDSMRSIGIIITMRGTERPHGVKWTRPYPSSLEPLDDESARALFVATSNCTEEDVQILLRAIDNIPLAIKLLGRLVDEDGLDYVLQQWRKEGLNIIDREDASDTRTTSVTASINLSLNSPRISSIQFLREVLAILAILPDGLSKHMVDVLEAGLPSGVNLSRILHALVRIALCYRDSHGRYRLLAPIRQHVQKALPLDPSFLHGVRITFLEYVIDADDADQDTVAAEMSNIRLFVASESTAWDETRISACISYLWWENRILDIQDIPLAIEALSHAHIPILEVRCRLRISEFLGYSSRYVEARDYLHHALSVKTGHPYWEGYARMEMGNIDRMLDKFEDAETFLQQAVILFKEDDSPEWEGVALERLGTLLRDWSRTSDAEVPLVRSLELARNAEDTLSEGNALCELGDVYRLTGRMSEAEDSLRQAIDCCRLSRSVRNEALACRSLGMVYYDRGDLEESEKSFLTSRDLHVRIHDRVGEADVLRWLGLVYSRMNGQLESAETHLKDSLLIFQQMSTMDNQAYVHEDLGDLYLQQGHFLKANTHWVVSIAFHLRRLHKSIWERVVPVCARIQEAL